MIEESYLINFFRKNDVQSVASPLYSRFFIFELSRMFFQIERREFFPAPCNAKSSIIFCTFWVGWCKRSVNFISNFSCSHLNQKPNEIIFLMSALASKGQIISECPYEKIVYPNEISNKKNSEISVLASKGKNLGNFFVAILG